MNNRTFQIRANAVNEVLMGIIEDTHELNQMVYLMNVLDLNRDILGEMIQTVEDKIALTRERNAEQFSQELVELLASDVTDNEQDMACMGCALEGSPVEECADCTSVEYKVKSMYDDPADELYEQEIVQREEIQQKRLDIKEEIAPTNMEHKPTLKRREVTTDISNIDESD